MWNPTLMRKQSVPFIPTSGTNPSMKQPLPLFVHSNLSMTGNSTSLPYIVLYYVTMVTHAVTLVCCWAWMDWLQWESRKVWWVWWSPTWTCMCGVCVCVHVWVGGVHVCLCVCLCECVCECTCVMLFNIMHASSHSAQHAQQLYITNITPSAANQIHLHTF